MFLINWWIVISHLTAHFFHSSSISSTYGAPLRTGELGGSTVGYPSSGIPNIGAEFGIRQSSAQIDELKKKLKMVITPVWMLQLKPLPLIKYESFKPLKKIKVTCSFFVIHFKRLCVVCTAA